MQNQKRVIIDRVSPQLNGGKFHIKRVIGQIVQVSADVLIDGHDLIEASILYKHEKENKWKEVRMQPTFNDDWIGSFTVVKQGFYSYKVQGWVDHALNWQHGILRKIEDQQKVSSELLEGITYLQAIKAKVAPAKKKYLLPVEQVVHGGHQI